MKKRRLFQLVFVFAVSIFSASVFAQSKNCKTVRRYTYKEFPGRYFATAQELCKALEAKMNAESKGERFTYTGFSSTCDYKVSNSSWRDTTYVIIDGSDHQECEQEKKCDAVAGKITKLSVPAGWVHIDSTGEMRDFKPSGAAPNQVCKGGCQYTLMSNEVTPGSTVYAPNINNGGYHPVFTQFLYVGSDTQCEAETDLTTPKNPPPPPEKPKEPEKPFTCPTGQCPGVVNGKNMCVPCNSGKGQGDGEGEDKGKDKKPGDSSGNKDGSEDGKKDGNKDGSKDGTTGGNGDGKGNGTKPGTGNGAGAGSGSGSGNGSGKSDSTGKRPGEGEKEGDGPPPQFGDRPGLYEPRYKDGVKGVWDEKSAKLKDTKMGKLSKRLMPSVNKGNCPHWTLDMNYGQGLNFGIHRLEPPCSIWPILRAIVIVCALILARRLVFGG